MAHFVTYWILVTSFLFVLTFVIVAIMYHFIKGIIGYIRWTKAQRARAVSVADAPEFENVTVRPPV